MKKTFSLLGIDDCRSVPIVGSVFVVGILIPLDKIELLKKIIGKNTKRQSKRWINYTAIQLMEKFEFHVIGITTKQSLEYDLCDLEAKAFYDIWWHFDNLDKTIVFANNFDDSREMFLKRLGKIDLAIKEDNWIITHDCDKKHLPGLAASIIAKYHRWENLKVLSEVKQFSGSSFANIPNNNGEAMDLGGIGWAAIPPKF